MALNPPGNPYILAFPKGQFLDLLFFLIYINDLTDNISSNIRLFADDSSLFLKVTNVNVAQLTLTEDLEKTHLLGLSMEDEV